MELALKTPDWIMRIDEDSAREVLARMDERIQQVEQMFMDLARSDPSLSGMGTTMTLAISLGADLFIAHVGDSRAYLLRRGRLHRLTRDHTIASAGERIDQFKRRRSPWAVLTHVIGTQAKGSAELGNDALIDGDEILLEPRDDGDGHGRSVAGALAKGECRADCRTRSGWRSKAEA